MTAVGDTFNARSTQAARDAVAKLKAAGLVDVCELRGLANQAEWLVVRHDQWDAALAALKLTGTPKLRWFGSVPMFVLDLEGVSEGLMFIATMPEAGRTGT